MKVVYARQDFPEEWRHSIFLAGPTPRNPKTPSWRPRALEILEELGYGGVVFVPEPEDGQWATNYLDQTEWERDGLEFADRIVFWVPRDLVSMPAFTTNVEFGWWIQSGKAVYGRPDGAEKTRYLDWLAGENDAGVHDTLEATLAKAIDGWDMYGTRRAGERHVPSDLWVTPMFRGWYNALRDAGNRLDDAKVLWTFRMPKKRVVFSYVLWVKVWIASEGRFKDNEWVFARSDIASIVLYRPPLSAANVDPAEEPQEYMLDTQLVLVREFRSPGRTDDGFVHEIPGGSTTDDTKLPAQIAAEEVAEETGLDLSSGIRKRAWEKTAAAVKQASKRRLYGQTGLVLDDNRIRPVGTRQLAATLSSHVAHAFAVELTEAEMAQAVRLAASGDAHGVEADTERTYVEVTTVRELLRHPDVDWTTIGIVMRALANPW